MHTIASAVLRGVAVLLAGTLVWGGLLAPLNLRVLPTLPWAVVPMTAYLWVYWRYAGGRMGSAATAASRRTSLRANPISPKVWALATVSGLVGFGALLTLTAVMARLMPMPASPPIAFPPTMPQETAAVLLVMASVVAGVTEEAAFRGYMQGPIERQYGVAAAILVNGTAFGLLHFPNHPNAVVQMLPYYISVAAVYGGLTWATDSILPAIVLHVGGDIWSLGRLWLTGRPEWQRSEDALALVWDGGVDTSFLVTSGALILLTAVAVALCLLLRRWTVNVAPASPG